PQFARFASPVFSKRRVTHGARRTPLPWRAQVFWTRIPRIVPSVLNHHSIFFVEHARLRPQCPRLDSPSIRAIRVPRVLQAWQRHAPSPRRGIEREAEILEDLINR